MSYVVTSDGSIPILKIQGRRIRTTNVDSLIPILRLRNYDCVVRSTATIVIYFRNVTRDNISSKFEIYLRRRASRNTQDMAVIAIYFCWWL